MAGNTTGEIPCGTVMVKRRISATDAGGKAVELAEHFDVVYSGQPLGLACPMFAEVWVTKLLNRDEFRRHCDAYVTPSAITANLE